MRYPVIGYLTRAYIRAGHIALLQTLRPDTMAGRLDYVEVTMRYFTEEILLQIHNRNIVCFKMLMIRNFSHHRRNKPWKNLCWCLRKRLRWLVTFGVTEVNIHYSDVIIGAIASQIIGFTIVYSTVYSGADQRIYQSSASLAFVRGIHRWAMNSPHKGPVTRKMVQFDDVIISRKCGETFV